MSMLPARSFCCFALALSLVLLFEPRANADYACDALSINIGTVANNPFSADEVLTSWQISPDGSKTQTGLSVVVSIARDTAGRVVVKRPAHFSSKEAREKNDPDFWYTTICDPTGTRTEIGQDVHFGETVDPSTGKHEALSSVAWQEIRVRSGRKTFPRGSINTEISPLRCASVEMTKGTAALPG
jgi:hypothetical protein